MALVGILARGQQWTASVVEVALSKGEAQLWLLSYTLDMATYQHSIFADTARPQVFITPTCSNRSLIPRVERPEVVEDQPHLAVCAEQDGKVPLKPAHGITRPVDMEPGFHLER